MPLTRRTTLSLAAGLVLALIAGTLAVLSHAGWNRATPWLNARASAALGRPFAIRGNLTLHWDRAPLARAGGERHWRDYLPWPHLVAEDVHLGNPADMAAGAELASVRRCTFSIDPLALLGRRIVIPMLRFDTPVIRLRRDADGKNNWTFPTARPDSPWQVALHGVALSAGELYLSDALRRVELGATVATLRGDAQYGLQWTLRGSYNGAPISGGGMAGTVLALRGGQPYPIAARLSSGGTSVELEGTLTGPIGPTALDLRLTVAGASMARLYALTGLLLPETPAFRTSGQLHASPSAQRSHWRYQNFTGQVGGSDIGGTLAYQAGAPRGKLTGSVSSRLLQMRDLAPLVGADSNASKVARGVAAVQPSDKLLPVEALRTERWTSIDADVQFRAAKIVREKALPISQLSSHIVLQDGRMTLQPLNFALAGGTVASDLDLDGSGKVDQHAIRARLTASARHLKIPQLFPKIQQLQASVGEINGDAALSATGNSIADLFGSANGDITTLIDRGSVSKLLLEEMGLNLGSVVMVRLFGDKQVRLNCLAGNFLVAKGQLRPREFVVDTDDAVLRISGTINLSDERLDLTLQPTAKGWRVLSLRAPLYVRGTLANPRVSVDRRVLALRAGGALALAAVAPLAALLPLTHGGPDQPSPCASLLRAATATQR